MNTRQAALGAGVAVLLVFGADANPAGAQVATALQASASQPACGGIKEAVRDAAKHAGTVVLDVALDAAGELLARAKQIF